MQRSSSYHGHPVALDIKERAHGIDEESNDFSRGYKRLKTLTDNEIVVEFK